MLLTLQLLEMSQVAAVTPATPATDAGDSEKCCYRSCRVKGAELLVCSANGCDKKVHMMCYQGLLLNKHPDLLPLLSGQAVCTKKCHGKVVKENSGSGGNDAKGGGRSGKWDCDGKDGPDDPNTSVKILLDWWMTEGNYSNFCGKNNNGVKKKQFCEQLADKMTKETLSNRTSKNVMSKIQHIEKSFKEAHVFVTSETGASIKETDEGTFKEAVKKKCPYYYDLVDIMSNRASAKPKVTSYDEEEYSDREDASDLSDDDKFFSTKKTNATDVTAVTSTSKKEEVITNHG
jgi:hypothetical protein